MGSNLDKFPLGNVCTSKQPSDCAIVALANVTQTKYDRVAHLCQLYGWNPETGMSPKAVIKVLHLLQHKILQTISASTLGDFVGTKQCTIRQSQHLLLFQSDVWLLHTSGHILAIRHGQILDWTKGRCHRIKSADRIGLKSDKIIVPVEF